MIINMTGGGGGTGATLTVNAPAGVTVTATKDEKTYTRVVNAQGVATFRGLSSGTWMLSISDATHEPSTPVPVVITADYTVTLKFFAATINVTYPAGSTLTCTDGNITLTATSTTGSYSFIVPNVGTWTVTATNGSQTDSKSVSITTDGQSVSVTLAYFSATISITYPAKSNCVVKNGSGETVASDSNTGSSAKTWTATVTATGTYTVTATATDGSDSTTSSSVSITADGQSKSVTLTYTVYLYNSGTIDTSFTGGLSAYAYVPSTSGSVGVKPTVTKNTSNIKLSISNDSSGGSYFTENTINLKPYSKLKIVVTSASTGTTDGSYVRFGATTSRKSGFTVSAAQTIASNSAGAVSSSKTFTIDISSLTGANYLFVTMYGQGSKTITFTKWYLEP